MDQRTTMRSKLMAAVAMMGSLASLGGFGNQVHGGITDYIKKLIEPWRSGRGHKHRSATPNDSHKQANARHEERRRRKARNAQRRIARTRGLARSHP